MFQCTTWPEHSPCFDKLNTSLGLPVNRFGKLCMTACPERSEGTLQSHLHSLSIVTCSTGLLLRLRLTAFPSRFKPTGCRACRDVCQTHAWLALSLSKWMVLLLHHLESKSFTYRDTQLLRFSDLAAHPSYLAVQFRANGSHTLLAREQKRCGSPLLMGFTPLAFFGLLAFICQCPLLPVKPAVEIVDYH